MHLARVAARARVLAEPSGLAEEAYVAGLLHDIGKYSELFMRRLEGRERGLDHWSAGAGLALLDRRLAPGGTLVAWAIAGHHVGLPSPAELQQVRQPQQLEARLHRENRRLTESDFRLLFERFRADGLTCPPGLPAREISERLDLMLEIRFLFSALVDADFLETEAHFEGATRSEGPPLEAERALSIVRGELEGLARSGKAAAEVQRLRADLARACLKGAEAEPGLFTLSAPTGSGKTLAMLAFALQHAARHRLRRIVLAVPYLSIVEQTVGVYRRLLEPAFGPRYVLEHHSLAQSGEVAAESANTDAESTAERLRRRLTENWDAPLVVTTNVQLLESLFANRPSRCRKLHALSKSVLLFDEAQAVPVGLAVPTLATLSRLAGRFGSSIVFATATQPAFDHLDDQVKALTAGGWKPREIVPPKLRLFHRARRVTVSWEIDRASSWSELAERLAELPQVLAIVNLKRHAQELAAAVLARSGREGLFHLSTNLCPAHRQRVLDAVRLRLADRLPCRLVATQCVEAGVDLDFPAAFRALGPLEAVAQAAGRCNRNGLGGDRLGEVVVFRPKDERYPGGLYQQAAQVTAGLLREQGELLDLDEPKTFRLYFSRLYDITGSTGTWETKKLGAALRELDFPTLAKEYCLIDQDVVNVVVPFDQGSFDELRRDLLAAGRLTRRWIRRARPQTVGLFRTAASRPGVAHFLDPVPLGRGESAPDWAIYTGDDYDTDLYGLQEAEQAWIA